MDRRWVSPEDIHNGHHTQVMPTLVLIRHGATQWNERDLFTGWDDAPLSVEGEAQARAVGRAFSKSQLSFDHCHTSRLTRARGTLALVLEEMGTPDIPVDEYWQLNETNVITARCRVSPGKP